MSDAELPDDVDQAAQNQYEAAMEAIGGGGTDDRPDPSEVASATKEEVLNLRDDGEKKTDEVTVKMSEGHRSMELERPSGVLIQWFEAQGDDIDTGAFAEVYARMVADPDLSADEWIKGDLTAYVDLIPIVMQRMEDVLESEFVENTTAAIEEHSDESTGN